MSEIIRLMVGPDMPDNAKFGQVLGVLRNEADLTRARAAEIHGFTSEYLRLIERGKRSPAAGTAIAMLKAYGIKFGIQTDNGQYAIKFRKHVIKFTSRIQEARIRKETFTEITTRLGEDGRPCVKLDESCLVVFISKDDDTFVSTSHYCLAVVETPEGVWLFNKRLA